MKLVYCCCTGNSRLLTRAGPFILHCNEKKNKYGCYASPVSPEDPVYCSRWKSIPVKRLFISVDLYNPKVGAL
jgi:hypothetical protein